LLLAAVGTAQVQQQQQQQQAMLDQQQQAQQQLEALTVMLLCSMQAVSTGSSMPNCWHS
jgi:hypothetical protein